jgi:hypothetical protein
MRIEYTLEPDRRMTRRANLLFYRRRIMVTRSIGVIFFLLGLFTTGLLSPVQPVGVILIVGGVVIFFELDVVYWYRARREHSAPTRQVHVVLDDECIQSEDGVSTSNVRWQAIDRVVENKDFWIIARGTSMIKYIPKAQLAPQQRAEFAEFLQRRPAMAS